MPRNGTGQYAAPASTWNPGVNGVTALTADFNALLDDIEAALSQSVSSDGQAPLTGNLQMGNNKVTGMATGTANTDATNLGQVTALVQGVAGQAGGSGDRNLLVNSNFAINQRVYASGVATTGANQVTLDRWRVVTSGQSITFGAAAPDRVVTCPAGGLEQIIEAAWVAGGVYTLSWTGTATAKVNGVAILTGGNTTSLPANTAITVQFASGTVDKVQFELGTAASTWQRRPPGLDFLLCQRDYCKSYALATVPGASTAISADQGYGAVGGIISTKIEFPVVMRVAPTILLWSNNGVASQWVAITTGGAATSYAASSANISDRNASVSVTPGAGEFFATGQWTAATGV